MIACAATTYDLVLYAYPGAQQAATCGLRDVFAVANRVHQSGDAYRAPAFRLIEADTAMLGDSQPAVIIVPPTLLAVPEPNTIRDVLAWMKVCHDRGTIVAAVCAGVFILAAAGILSGRSVTTHWRSAERLRAAYPDISVDPDRLLVDDGDILTVAGVMSWPDLALRLIERLLGPAAMAETARELLIDLPWREQRSYRPFVETLTHGDRAILKVQHWVRSVAARQANVGEMVGMSGLEERTFLRRFRRATGMTPIDYIQHLRVERARDLLQTTPLAIEAVAWEAGYQDAGAFTKLFLRVTGLAPTEYRKRFALRSTL